MKITSTTKKRLDHSIEKIWRTITDNSHYAWRSDLLKIEVIDARHFTEYTKNSYPTEFTIVKQEYLREYRLDFKNSNIAGHWLGEFQKLDSHTTQLTFTETIKTNRPSMRLLAKPYLKSQQKRYLRDLEKYLSHDIK